MALDAEEFDFQGLGSKLTNTILDSFDDALGKIKFSSVGTSLTTALSGVDMAKALSKPLGDGITKLTKNDPNISKAMKDVQKMLEDGFTKIKFKTGPVKVANISPQVVKLLADASGLKVPKIKAVEVPVIYKPGKLQQLKAVNVDVNYKLTSIPTPKVKAVEVPVKYKLSELPSPKVKSIEIPVKYKADKLEVLKSEPVTVPVEYDYGKFQLPKNQKLEVPVTYIYSKFNLPKTTKLTVPVNYNVEKLTLEKVKQLTVPVKYNVDKLTLPKPSKLNVPITYQYSKLVLPKGSEIDVPVNYIYDKFKTPKGELITVPVEYEYSKFQLPKGQELEVPVSYVYSKFNLPKTSKIDVPVEYSYERLSLPKVKELTIPVHYKVDKLTLPKTPQIQIPVTYVYSKLTLPKAKAIEAPVEFIYDKLVLPKINALQARVQFVYDKLTLPKVNPVEVLVRYIYSKFTLPKVDNILVNVSYDIDALKLPKTKELSVPVHYLYEKFTLPKAPNVSVSISPDTTKLTTGLAEVADKTKTAIDGVFVPRTISVDVDTTNAEKKLSSTFSTTNVPVTAVSQAAATAPQTPTISTGPLEKAGNLVREFVILTEEANKKTKITSELYTKIVSIAEKLVATKRMEKSAADELNKSLLDKTEMPTTVSTNLEPKTTKTAKKIQEVEIHTDTTSVTTKLEKVLETFTKALVKMFDGLDFSNLNSKITKSVSKVRPKLDFGMGGSLKDDIFEILNELKEYKQLQSTIAGSTLEDYQTAQKRLDVAKTLKNASRDELVDIAKKLGIAGAEYQKSGNLKNLIADRLVVLQKEKVLRDNLLNATDDYNNAIKQANSDIAIKQLTIGLHLTEQETSELALQTKNKNEALLAAGKLTEEEIKQVKANNGLLNADIQHIANLDKTLRHKREEVELVEHVANYQKEVNEELEKYSMGWKKTKATMSAIIKDPAFAKGVFLAGAIASIEKLHHSMHEFMDVGMTAGEGVAATFKTMSVESIMGLSKSKDVLVSMVQKTGNMNTFTKDN